MPARRRLLGGLAAVALAGCLGGGDGGGENGDGDGDDDGDGNVGTTTASGGADPSLESPAFEPGTTIPTEYTCDGEDVSPPLRVRGVPDGVESLAVVVDDPDAPSQSPFVHWLLWNVPPGTTEIPEDVPQESTVAALDGAAQGTNDFGEVGYRGPCPPAGDGPHTYRFTVHALDSTLALGPGARRDALEEAMESHRRGETTITAEYER